MTSTYVILKAAELDRTIAWYEAAGFHLRGRHRDGDRDWCELARDGAVVQFLAGPTPWEGAPTMTGCLYVAVADAAEALAALRAPVTAEWGIEEREWGAKEIVLRDPDGYFITLVEG